MQTTTMKLCAWSGVAAIVLVAIGFLLAGFIPPPLPSDSAAQTAQMYRAHATGIRFGMIIVMYGSTLLMPFAAIITIQMRRIEGRHPVLALTQFGVGSLFVLEFIYLAFFWITGTYRAERSPEIVQTLNDMGWIPFIGLSSTLVLQSAVFGGVILSDSKQRYFPRWLGYYNLWAALIFTPGTFNMFFHHGPLAWNGIIAFWIPVPVFVSWLIINSILLAKSVDRAAVEDATTQATAAEHLTVTGGPTAAIAPAVAAELAELRTKVTELGAMRDEVARVAAKVGGHPQS
jgi:hypothetical protein